jgi:hypothetical protein
MAGSPLWLERARPANTRPTTGGGREGTAKEKLTPTIRRGATAFTAIVSTGKVFKAESGITLHEADRAYRRSATAALLHLQRIR